MSNFTDNTTQTTPFSDEVGTSLSFSDRDSSVIADLNWRNNQYWRNGYTWQGIGGSGGGVLNFTDNIG